MANNPKQTRLRSWRSFRIALLALILTLVVSASYLRLAKGYVWADATGFEGKTLWDWMELLVVPLVLAFGALWFSKKERENEQKLAEQRAEVDRQIAADRNQEGVLQAYLDKMTELLLDKQLLRAKPDSDLQAIAQARTTTTLRRLDGERKGILLRFLSLSRLLTLERGRTEAFIHLGGWT